MTDARDRYRGDVAASYDADRAGRKWDLEQRTMRRMLAEIPRGSSILDVPVGTARYAAFYRDHGHRVIGLDISMDMLRQIAAGTCAGRVRGDVTAIPLRDRAVDYVVSTRLMNWLEPAVLRAALAEISRVAIRGVILGIREVERLAIAQAGPALREALTHPTESLRRLVRPLHAKTIVLHPTATIHRVFERSGLRIVRSEWIDEGTAFTRRLLQFAPLRTYLLAKA